MFSKIFQIDNSKIGFSADGIHLFAPKKEKGFVVCDLKNGAFQEYTTDFDVFEILIISNKKIIVTETYERTAFMYEYQNGSYKFTKDMSYFSIFSAYKNVFAIRKLEIKNKQKVKSPALYDWQKDEILWEAPYDLFFLDDYIIGRRFNAPSRLSPNTGEVLWEYSFADYPKTKSVHGVEQNVAIGSHHSSWVGVLDNELWLTLNNYQLLILDINSGKRIDLLGEPVKRGSKNKKYVIGGIMDEKSRKIINVGNFEYREIDMKTREVKYVDLTDEFDKYGVSSCECKIDDNYIYFYDKIFFGEQPRNKVAVLDRKTLKVVWVHDFAQYGTFPMQLEKNDTHLFVLDSGGTLHIFEKETAQHT